jgi:hypothetical protein
MFQRPLGSGYFTLGEGEQVSRTSHINKLVRSFYLIKVLRNDTSTYCRVRWRPLRCVESKVIDLIVMILVHALRSGMIKGSPKTNEDVLIHIDTQPLKALVWEYPSFPFIPAITSCRVSLDFKKPASAPQLQYSLIEAGDTKGPYSMPLDTRHPPRRHSNNAYNNGVTATYVERESKFIVNAKEE